MKTILMLAVVIALSGCGTFTDANYVLISKGQSDGLGGVFTGGVDYCKLSVKGDAELVSTMSPDDFKKLCESVDK